MRGYTVRTLFFRVLSTSLSLCLSFFITKTYIKSTWLRNNFKSFTLTLFLSLSFFDSVPHFVCLSVCLSLSLYLSLSIFHSLSIYLTFALSLSLHLIVPLSFSPSNCPSLFLTWQASWHWGLLIICPLSCMLRAHEVSRPESLLYRSVGKYNCSFKFIGKYI